MPLFAWKAILISGITVFWLTVQCVYNAWYWLQCAVYTSPFCTRVSQIHPPTTTTFFFWKRQTDEKRRLNWAMEETSNTFWRHVPSLGDSCYKHKEHWSEEPMQDMVMLVASCCNNATKEEGSSGSIVLFVLLIHMQGISAPQFQTMYCK